MAVIGCSKTGHADEGTDPYLSPRTGMHLKRWLAVAEIAEGAIFRVVKKGGRICARLGSNEVVRVVKRVAEQAGLTPITSRAWHGKTSNDHNKLQEVALSEAIRTQQHAPGTIAACSFWPGGNAATTASKVRVPKALSQPAMCPLRQAHPTGVLHTLTALC
jgi:hypothetical protein